MAIRIAPIAPPAPIAPLLPGVSPSALAGSTAPPPPAATMPAPALAEPASARPTRARYLSGDTDAARQPWIADGVSRATWYRRRAASR